MFVGCVLFSLVGCPRCVCVFVRRVPSGFFVFVFAVSVSSCGCCVFVVLFACVGRVLFVCCFICDDVFVLSLPLGCVSLCVFAHRVVVLC